MRGETPRDFFHVITLGRRRAGMPAWGDALSLQDRWDVVAYLWTLARPTAAIPEGQGIWVAQCAGCHAATGDGTGQFAAGLTGPVPDLTGIDPLAGRTDAEIAAIITGGVAGTPMPAFGRLLDAGQVAAVTAFVRTIGLGGPIDKAGSAARPAESHHPDATAAFTAARELVDRAVAAYRAGDAGASALATDAYTRFEPLEKAIGARDAAAVRGVEEAFLRLRTALRTPAPRPTSRPPRWRWTTVSTPQRRCSPRAADGPGSRSRSRSSSARDSRSSSSSRRCSPTCDAGAT